MKLLIVVDMQNDFIDGALGTAEAVKILPCVKEKVAAFDGEVLFTRDTHENNYMETQEGKYLPVPHCIRNSFGWEIHSDLKPFVKNPPMDKPTFGSTALVDYLIKQNEIAPIEEITLCGLCTDICVISNAMLAKATLPEVPVMVDAKCCAGVTPESHARALDAMRMCQIQIIE